MYIQPPKIKDWLAGLQIVQAIYFDELKAKLEAEPDLELTLFLEGWGEEAAEMWEQINPLCQELEEELPMYDETIP